MQTFKQFLTENRADYKYRLVLSHIVTNNMGDKVHDGSVHFWGLNIKELPDLSDIIVTEDFDCSSNDLTNLKGAPKRVLGHFNCKDNPIRSLTGAPEFIGGEFFCGRFTDADYRQYVTARETLKTLDPETTDLFGGMIDTL